MMRLPAQMLLATLLAAMLVATTAGTAIAVDGSALGTRAATLPAGAPGVPRVGLTSQAPAVPRAIHDLGTTQGLMILPIVEAASDRADLITEPGVAYLIRTDRQTILLDLGHNASGARPSTLVHNLQALGLRLEDVDLFVISHPHPDHVGGVQAWRQHTLAFGNDPYDLAGRSVVVPTPTTYPGATPVLAADPVVLGPGVATTGALPFANPFPISLLEPRAAEQALAIDVAGHGIVLITGCGHPGLETLVARARQVFDDPVVGVVGGLHDQDLDARQLAPQLDLLRSLRPQLVALSPHDSGPAALAAFHDAFPNVYREVRIGSPIRFGTSAED